MQLTDQAIRECAIPATLEVLDTMFFELPVDVPAECSGPGPGALAAHAHFTGSAEGELVVSTQRETLRRMTAAFLGMEEEAIPDSESSAVLCELANMLCGSAVSRIDPSARITIDCPQIISAAEVSPRPWLRFPLECGSLAISLTYKGL